MSRVSAWRSRLAPVSPWLMLALQLVMLAALPPAAQAHQTSYSYADLDWRGDRVAVVLRVHRDDAATVLGVAVPESLMQASFLEPRAPELGRLLAARFQARCDGRALAWRVDSTRAEPDRRTVRLVFAAACPPGATRLAVSAKLFPDDALHETFLELRSNGRLVRQSVLSAQSPGTEIAREGAAEPGRVFATFMAAGVHHIFIGPDHVLFVVGLLLLGGGLTRVLKVATAFTAAHSITLALAATGQIAVPNRIVEPLIALSIVYIGIENLRHRPGGPDRRTVLAFGFGLVHGLGFASVLREFGLPQGALAVSLLAFNVGVEAGQACIVLTVTPLLGMMRTQHPAWAVRAVAAGSCAIIAAGGYWFVERLLAGA